MNLDDWQRFFGAEGSVVADLFDASEQAGRHFIRQHSAELVDAGALLRWRGQWLAHRTEFPKLAVRIGQRMARRAVERHASDVHSAA